MRRKIIMLAVCLAVLAGCATPSPVASKIEKAGPPTHTYKVGDEVRIQIDDKLYLDVIVVNVLTRLNETTGKIETLYRLKSLKYYTLPEGDPLLVPRPKVKEGP